MLEILQQNKAATTVSDRYGLIPTKDVVDYMLDKGYTIKSVRQNYTRKPEWKGFEKHIVQFGFPEGVNVLDSNDRELRLYFVNSFNGTSRASFGLSVYEKVCYNGMHAYVPRFGLTKIRHTLKHAHQFMGAYCGILDMVPIIANQVKAMQNKVIPYADQYHFSCYALGLRWDANKAPFGPSSLLLGHHREQTDPTVWNITNRIQENIIKGFCYKDTDGKFKKVRAVKAIDTDLKVNQSLWEYASSLV